MVALPPSGRYEIQEEAIWRICLKRLKQASAACPKQNVFFLFAGREHTHKKETEVSGSSCGPHSHFPPGPGPPQAMLSHCFYLSPGAKIYASSLFYFLSAQKPAEFQNGPRALFNSFQAPALAEELPWMMGLKVR